MTLHQAIERAIEGGWKAPYEYGTFEATENYIYFYPRSGKGRIDYAMGFVLLDPSFWQALGKSEGRADTELPLWTAHKTDGGTITIKRPWWNVQMHHFIDHLCEGRSIESFFEGI